MATYTMQLRTVADYYSKDTVISWFNSYKLSDYLLPEQLKVVESSQIFNKLKLATKIVDYFWLSEIGFDTPAMFRHYAIQTMEQIMEEKLPLIYSASLEYDPLVNVDFKETFNRDAESSGLNEGSSNSSSNSDSSGLSVNSNTPQGQISKQTILNGTYASSTVASESNNKINDSTSSTTSGKSHDHEFYTRHMKR